MYQPGHVVIKTEARSGELWSAGDGDVEEQAVRGDLEGCL